ncbi:hypothetical protein [Paenibacillus aceris]|uniref:Uncharacterized protein n=1 Tax=Paenibacillus aceris TaxID=869555 RepID=A0ABS4I7Q3_9BACL|nr:hypothetical protein [Paenibacillus aceris]MBP1966426.1 hypothetical protein [Paenibacillus aceris]NHW39592.1 hypothetical protein [Paenibacillus aceris]
MSKSNDAALRKQLASMLVKIAERIEQDEEFARWLLEGTIWGAANKGSKSKKPSTASELPYTPAGKSPLPDIYDIFSKDGAEALRELLNTYEVGFLIEIVLANGLDPVRKVRKWKTKHKIIAYMLEAVAKQMAKGKAFVK